MGVPTDPEQLRAYHKARKQKRAERIARGQCIACDEPSAPGKARCASCAEHAGMLRKDREAKYVAAGLCRICGKAAAQAGLCSKHILSTRTSGRELKRKLRANPVIAERLRAQDRELRARSFMRDPKAAWLKQGVKSARERALKRGLAFSLTPQTIALPDHCPVLGIPLDYHAGKRATQGGPSPNSPSLDRINNAMGYVDGNVQVISVRANRIKSDSTLQELKALVAHLERLALDAFEEAAVEAAERR